MNWRRNAAVVAAMLGAVTLGSCSGRSATAVGESNDLIIVRDPDGAASAAAYLANAMQSEVSWLADEPAFEATMSDVEAFALVSGRRHIMLVGTWGGSVEPLVRRRVTGLEKDRPPRLHIVEDIWAKGQLVGLIMGQDEEALLAYMAENRNEILASFEEAAVAKLVQGLVRTASPSGVPANLEARFGWSLSPPTDYDLFTGHAAERFVFFRRIRPDRTVFVYWEPGGPGLVTEDFVVSRREQLARQYLDGDELEQKRGLAVDSVDIAGRPALRVSGWWANRRLIGAGPFRTYCFHEPSQGRVYLVDVSLFAPGQDKVQLMRNLDAIARSFSVAAQPRQQASRGAVRT